MSHATDGSTTGGGAQAARCAKERDRMFAASQKEKSRLAAETASYRLKDGAEKFSSSSNAVEVALATQTVGLVTKEEFARRRMALEAGCSSADAASAPADEGSAAAAASAGSKEKKKKKKEKSTLSFGFDEEGEDAEAVVLPKKKVKSEHTVSTSVAPPAAAPAAKESAPPAALAPPPLPEGCTCVREVAQGRLELSLECYCSASVAKTRVKHLTPMTITIDVKAKDSEANPPLCAFLSGLLGGGAASELKCEVVRGHRAPVKVVRVDIGPAASLSAELAFYKLKLAQQASAKEAAATAPPRPGLTTFNTG